MSKRNSGKPLTDQDRAWLWSMWQEHRSERKLSMTADPNGRKFARSTVHRIRIEDDWDRRGEEIRLEAQRSADATFAKDRAQLLNFGRGLGGRIAKKLVDDDGDLIDMPKITDFVTLGKFLLQLQGDPTERIEVHVRGAQEQLAQVMAEAINDIVEDKGQREQLLAALLGGLGRIRAAGRDSYRE